MVEFPEDGYHGDDIRDHARDYISLTGTGSLGFHPRKEEGNLSVLPFQEPERIRKSLEGYGVVYDNCFSEQSCMTAGNCGKHWSTLRIKGIHGEGWGRLVQGHIIRRRKG